MPKDEYAAQRVAAMRRDERKRGYARAKRQAAQCSSARGGGASERRGEEGSAA